MKRTPLKRGTTRLKRSRLKAKRGKQRRSGRVRDSFYMGRVREMPCRAGWIHMLVGVLELSLDHAACSGPMHAHHAGKHAAGRKADDSTCIALCSAHHDQLHSLSGAFKSWTRAEVREWEDKQVAFTRDRLGWKETA